MQWNSFDFFTIARLLIGQRTHAILKQSETKLKSNGDLIVCIFRG